jgi:hypothetical protein
MRTAGPGRRIPATRRRCARRNRPAPGPSQCTSIGKFLQADRNNKNILLFCQLNIKIGHSFWICKFFALLCRVHHKIFSLVSLVEVIILNQYQDSSRYQYNSESLTFKFY